jgi:hypothetical protein
MYPQHNNKKRNKRILKIAIVNCRLGDFRKGDHIIYLPNWDVREVL